jgi:hypothetical protein
MRQDEQAATDEASGVCFGVSFCLEPRQGHGFSRAERNIARSAFRLHFSAPGFSRHSFSLGHLPLSFHV